MRKATGNRMQMDFSLVWFACFTEAATFNHSMGAMRTRVSALTKSSLRMNKTKPKKKETTKIKHWFCITLTTKCNCVVKDMNVCESHDFNTAAAASQKPKTHRMEVERAWEVAG